MHIFLDESGKPEVFSSKGVNLVEAGTATKHLVLAAIKVKDQLQLQKDTLDFKSSLLSDVSLKSTFSAAYALDSFHAKNDYPSVRRRFYEFIAALGDNIEIHAIVVEKLLLAKALQREPIRMYGIMAGLMVQGICHQDAEAEIIFSRQDNGTKFKDELNLQVDQIRESYWSRYGHTPTGISVKYQHNPHYSHGGLQIADYVAYAVFQYYEKGNPEYLRIIQAKVRHIHHYNQKRHFTRSRPLELS